MNNIMIPEYNNSGTLPPFLAGTASTNPTATSPYKVSLQEVITHFNTSIERCKILIGFLNYRKELKKVGFTNGFQWIDGSFVENVESTQKRAPQDLDVVTFSYVPSQYSNPPLLTLYLKKYLFLFDNANTKPNYKTDAYFICLNHPPEYIIDSTRYFFGLFSHQRVTYIWKGLLEISLQDQEDPCIDYLINGGFYAP